MAFLPLIALTVRWPPLGGTDFKPSLRLGSGSRRCHDVTATGKSLDLTP